VVAKWTGQTRPGTNQVAAGSQAFEALLLDILTNNPKANMAKLTVEDARTWIAPQNYDALWTKLIKDPMDATVEFNKRKVVLATDALAVMKKNAELWAYEDRVVPGSLQCSVKIYYLNGGKDQFQQVIDNSLPSQPHTPYVKASLPTISPSKAQVFGKAREGYADVPDKTKPHRGNWREFVNAQYGLINQKLLTKFTAAEIDIALGKHYQEALALANQLDDKSSRKAPTVDPLTVDVSAGQLTAPKELQDRLNAMWNDVRKEVTPDAPDVLVPEWGPMVTGGMGSWVRATYTRNATLPAGSAASGTKTVMPWMDDMLTHRGYDVSKNGTIYVRGHLLNDHLGGPATPFNLVPLTGEPTASSANANKTHEGSVESMAKEAVARLYFHRDNPQLSPSGSDITKVEYHVEAKWPGPTRASTAKVAAAAQAFETLLADIKTDRPKTNMTKLTVEQARQSIAFNKYDALWTNLIKDAVDAVLEVADRDRVKAKDALAVMKKNAELWAYEDRVVPGSLQCSVKIHFLNSGSQQFNQVIDNSLPTRAYAPYVKQ
jgi:hypothetical protein